MVLARAFGAGLREALWIDFRDLDGPVFAALRPVLEAGNLLFTALTALEAVFTVPEEINVFPLAARFPMIVPAIAPATAPTGPAMTLPTMAPATPPAVCFETGRLLLG